MLLKFFKSSFAGIFWGPQDCDWQHDFHVCVKDAWLALREALDVKAVKFRCWSDHHSYLWGAIILSAVFHIAWRNSDKSWNVWFIFIRDIFVFILLIFFTCIHFGLSSFSNCRAFFFTLWFEYSSVAIISKLSRVQIKVCWQSILAKYCNIMLILGVIISYIKITVMHITLTSY